MSECRNVEGFSSPHDAHCQGQHVSRRALEEVKNKGRSEPGKPTAPSPHDVPTRDDDGEGSAVLMLLSMTDH